MPDLIFVTGLGLLLGGLLWWGFRTLPGERWQILATIPLSKNANGSWRGINITWYGLLSATAYVLACALMFVLTGSIGVSPLITFSIILPILAAAMPASRIMARIVEKKKHTFTVAGAFFVAVLIAPPVLWLVNLTIAPALHTQVPFLPIMATMAIAYAIGEGIGRLACISFGCCYGKPVADTHPLLARLFTRWNFIFFGDTKKIAYASHLQGVPVVPVQAITAVLYVGTGLVSVYLFLQSHFVLAFVITMAVTQLWRIVSELMRADYRGAGKLSAYQLMAAVATVYAMAIGLWLTDVPLQPASISRGLETLWDPGMLLFLQLLWTVSFVYMGKSSVTEARMEIQLCGDKI
jgi:prolipoprotein diacylglyceryltransferase